MKDEGQDGWPLIKDGRFSPQRRGFFHRHGDCIFWHEPCGAASAAKRIKKHSSDKDQSHDSRQQNVLGDVVDYWASATLARDSVVPLREPISILSA